MRARSAVYGGLALVALSASVASAQTPTFSKDVAPILYSRCVECHRTGSIAPMSLTSYDETRPWARSIRQKVVDRVMPPWGADPHVGKFSNDPSLTDAQIKTIVAWVDGGAPEGRRADLPKMPTFTEGWSIGKPDMIFKMTEAFHVPADGTVPYSYVTIPTNLKEDIWITAVELKPSDRRVVHHIISDLLEDDGKPAPPPSLRPDRTRKEVGGLGGYVPGRQGTVFEPGVARRIPAGADIQLQMHYTTIGQAIDDQTEIGVVLAKGAPSTLRRAGGGQMLNAAFAIPPGNPSYEVMARQVMQRDTLLTAMYPHMHVRGKDVVYKAIYPDGKEEVLLSVPNYDFNWQLTYELAQPKLLPKGTTLAIVAHYDNSPANRYNPDPTATVKWGEQTWEEMLIGYFSTVEPPASASSSASGANGAR